MMMLLYDRDYGTVYPSVPLKQGKISLSKRLFNNRRPLVIELQNDYS